MKIIALYGPQKSGKSEAAKAIALRPGWIRLSFADPLYDMLSTLLNTDSRLLDKSETAEGLCGKTVRHALQSLGTNWGREMIGQTIWIDAMKRNLESWGDFGYNVVIDDLRFANEYTMLRKLGATILRVNRAGLDTSTVNSHSSEVDWMFFRPDRVVENSGSVEDWADYWRGCEL